MPLTEAGKKRVGAFKPTREVRAAWAETLGLARALRSRIVLFQSPASFAPTATDIRNLAAFFERAERGGLAFAWEPRGEWSDTEVGALCKRLDLIHCVDPFQRRPVWGEPGYFRLHGRGGYHYTYSEAELKELGALVEPCRESYILFNNTGMFDDARRFRVLCCDLFQMRRNRVAG